MIFYDETRVEVKTVFENNDDIWRIGGYLLVADPSFTGYFQAVYLEFTNNLDNT